MRHVRFPDGGEGARRSRLVRSVVATCAAAAVVAAFGAAVAASSPTSGIAPLLAGVYGKLPTSAPSPKKESVWVVSCSQAAIGCSLEAGGAMAGGKVLGWNMKLCDGKFDTNDAWGSCFRQAIAAHANGIIGIGIGCAAIKQPLQEAKAAGVKTISSHDFDCNDPYEGGSAPLFSTHFVYTPQLPTAAAYWTAVGKADADYLIAKTGGKAKVIELTFPEVIYTRYLDKGLRAGLKKCGGCSIADQLNLSVQDQATNQVPPKFSAVLLKHPEANAVTVPFDSLFVFGLRQAIISSGRASKLTVLGGFGEPEVMPYIKAGSGVNAVVASPIVWFGWASVDELNRSFAGQAPVPEGLGYQAVDSPHNLPPSGKPYQPPIDFAAAYKKAWHAG
jgi:ribose transport system substrate-binding protein